MKTRFLVAVLVSACLAALLKAVINFSSSHTKSKWDPDHLQRLPLPPEVPSSSLPLISGFLWFRKSSLERGASLRSIRARLGPIVTLPLASTLPIFISSRTIAHKALVENGAVLTDRPKQPLAGRIMTCNQHHINSNGYGDKWHILRRNLTSHILHPSQIKLFSAARSSMVRNLVQRLRDSESPVNVIQHLRYAIFCLLCFMCFGDRLDEQQILEVEAVHQRLLLAFPRVRILNVCPLITKLVFSSWWRDLFDIMNSINVVVVPLIRASKSQNDAVPAYVDSLLELELPEDGDDDDNGGTTKRKMKEEEIVGACSELLTAGADPTSTILQWILANLVKNQRIRTKLFHEILSVVGPDGGGVKEEDLSKMEYLKAVVMEGLRRHPPGHSVLPHSATKEVELDGYRIPKDAVLNFTVADMGWDPEVWVNPMEFNPERFLGADVDITGSREIKMMPFGVGRRICPGLSLAMLHLECFLANLVWEFEWTESEEYPVDFSEKQEFTIVMKHPLRAKVTPRSRS